MTKHKAKIPAVLATAVVVSFWIIVGAAYGQSLDASGPDQVAAGTWTRLTHQPTFLCDTALLLTDGRVMVHQYGDPNHNGQGMNNWWALTPDANGSYLN